MKYRGVVQLVERWSPKPNVVGSSPTAPAKNHQTMSGDFLFDRKLRRNFSILFEFKNIIRGAVNNFT